MPALHAPAGGVTIHGIHFPGGRFVPAEVADSLTPEDRAKAEKGGVVGDAAPSAAHSLRAGPGGVVVSGPKGDLHWPEGMPMHPGLAAGYTHEEQDAIRSGTAHGSVRPATRADRLADGHYAAGDWDPDKYFDIGDAAGRASHFLDAHREGDADLSDFDADTLDAVAEDLAGYSADADDYASGVIPALAGEALVSEGSSYRLAWESPAGRLLSRAMASSAVKPPPPFDPGRGDYAAVDLTSLDAEAVAVMDALRPVFKSADGSLAVFDRSKADIGGAVESLNGHFPVGLDDEEGLQAIFAHLPDPQVRESDVPAAARNFGRVSGGGDGTLDTGDFDPNAVDAYRPMSRGWYLLRRGTHSVEVLDGGPTYEVVARKNLPPRSSLPPPFWAGLQAHDPGTVDDDAAEARRSRGDAGGTASDREDAADFRQRRRTAKERFKEFDRQYGRLRQSQNLLEGKHARANAHQESADTEYLTAGELNLSGADAAHDAAATAFLAAMEAGHAPHAPGDAPEIDADDLRDLVGYTPPAPGYGHAPPTEHVEEVENAVEEAGGKAAGGTGQGTYAKAAKKQAKAHAKIDAKLAAQRGRWLDIARAARAFHAASLKPVAGLTMEERQENADGAKAVYGRAVAMARRLGRRGKPGNRK